MSNRVDVLAIGAHPDDIELSCGGTVAKLVADGHKVALADVTQGELGTRGTKEIRLREAVNAAKVLGVATRVNLKIPDGGIELSKTNIRKVITLIRDLRPKILIIPHSVERHPDHVHTHNLCKEAWFYSGLRKIKTSLNGKAQDPHRPDNFFEFMQWYEYTPSFIVDITNTFEIKMKAIRAHASQFHDPKSKDPETILSRPEFLDRIQTEAEYYGKKIGVRYAEPFYSWTPLGVNTIFDFVLTKG
jgi:bacillithiol biosynthesis deacetylase BshB1